MSITAPSIIESARLRRVFAAHPSGVTALAATVDETPVGMIASTFTAVSLEPALVSVCIAHSSTTWPTLRKASHLGLSLLSSQQQHAGRALSGHASERFTALDWRESPTGAILLDNASAWFETTLHDVFRAGDHDIVVLRVRDLDVDESTTPLVYHGSAFRQLA
ncbi:MAG TPA: flavin reductase family protein [Flexivirga sp.]|uniref:flavin reductase family protein n=1 Tax=Flexivirga sp. TaxID=1962927 RepID=UPI002B5D66BC|nr:flavin reductase family protein [Flexivirga sp.]HWC21563.1 flavin reductase family protein [Flexivirga sp.]